MTRSQRIVGITVLLSGSLALAAACASTPQTRSEDRALQAEADAALRTMKARDPTLVDVLDRSHGYVVFPEVGKGGALVGGAHGIGVVYERGRPIGYAELSQASLGLQLGGQTLSELLVFENRDAIGRLKAGNFDLSGNASAVGLRAGAAAATRFESGVAVFVMPRFGLMVELSVAGQQISFEPLG